MNDSKHPLGESESSHEAPTPGAPAPGDGGPRPGAQRIPVSGTRDGAGEPQAANGVPAQGGGPGAGGEPASRGPAAGDGAAAEVEGDLDELVKRASERDEYLALAQRTQADFENYRKRVARESAAAQERGVAALAKELLPALDNLNRAIAEGAEDDPLLAGVKLVRAELAAALARLGVDSFSPAGEAFDPSLHEAVATVPQEGSCASGTVAEVYQEGYRLGSNVIRPARVVVSA